ncbi:uncharacterized protein K452DRAFT_31448 [Aplosporella prunicola CBS 121167]|uniref:Uncharacterized protein n=1 Tax=Aplosporella prunicola CBS 121167 TaxID=1176127 RepID=A0A6A6BBS2_9PEZI|nr:uncharacterized protein K452DRAFT_31448 [Aplosporella prunicola CBS 121167]KAF2141649.1 hypothetical protein K452DRAFT_31448 [Aplosporella prunicola CBS 121167]
MRGASSRRLVLQPCDQRNADGDSDEGRRRLQRRYRRLSKPRVRGWVLGNDRGRLFGASSAWPSFTACSMAAWGRGRVSTAFRRALMNCAGAPVLWLRQHSSLHCALNLGSDGSMFKREGTLCSV